MSDSVCKMKYENDSETFKFIMNKQPKIRCIDIRFGFKRILRFILEYKA